MTSAKGMPGVRRNVGALLDVVDANRHVWLATIAVEGDSAPGQPAARLFRESMLQQMLANNADLFEDTSWARLCLTGYLGFCDAACRRWVLGEATRGEVETALIETLLHLLKKTIPRGPS